MENALNVEHRLTEVEQRAKSNTHRIDKAEDVINEIHKMANTLVQLVEEVKHTNETVNSLDAKVDRVDSRVDEMERAPAKRSVNVKEKIADAALKIITEFLIVGLLWAAVQAF